MDYETKQSQLSDIKKSMTPLMIEQTPDGVLLNFNVSGVERNLGHLNDDNYQMLLENVRVFNLLFLYPDLLLRAQEGRTEVDDM